MYIFRIPLKQDGWLDQTNQGQIGLVRQPTGIIILIIPKLAISLLQNTQYSYSGVS